MSLARSKRGQMRVIETILASMIIISALSFVTLFAVAPSTPVYEASDLEKMGYSAFHDLDQQGLLAPLVYNRNWSEIRSLLKITMPVDVYFNLDVYYVNGTKINEGTPIVYGDIQTFNVTKNVASVAYTIAGYPQRTPSGNYTAPYDLRILVLQISRG